jgi:uncharacterized protein (TIGR03382 family)
MWWLLGPDCLPGLADPRFAREPGRPELSGEERVYSRGRWVAHATDAGTDAVDLADADADGIPDIVQRLFDALDLAAAAYEDEGWRPILDDDGRGGDANLDVYFRVVDINGYAYPVAVSGKAGHSCYMEVDPGLASQGRLLESVAVHELHHCVQFAYTTDSEPWIYEATATWEQYRTWPSDTLLDLGLAVLWGARLADPQLPLDDVSGRYEYAGFVFLKFWTEYTGVDEGRLPALWEALRDEPDWATALDAEARRMWSISLDEAYLAYSTWNGFACARDDGRWRGDVLGCASTASVPVAPVTDGVSVVHPDAAYVASYAEVAANGDPRPVQVTCGAAPDGAWAGLSVSAVTAEGEGGESVTSLPGAGAPVAATLTGPIDPNGTILLTFTSTGAVPADVDCTITRVEPADASTGCGCGSAAGGSSAALALAMVAVLRRRR